MGHRMVSEFEVWIDKSVLKVSVWHHEADRVLLYSDPQDRSVNPNPSLRMESFFSCTPLGTNA